MIINRVGKILHLILPKDVSNLEWKHFGLYLKQLMMQLMMLTEAVNDVSRFISIAKYELMLHEDDSYKAADLVFVCAVSDERTLIDELKQ